MHINNQIEEHGTTWQGQRNTCLLNAFTAGIKRATNKVMSDVHIRAIIAELRPDKTLQFMAPLDDNSTSNTAVLHPIFQQACWQYEVNLVLYNNCKMCASFVHDASFPTVHLTLTNYCHWQTYMPRDTKLRNIQIEEDEEFAHRLANICPPHFDITQSLKMVLLYITRPLYFVWQLSHQLCNIIYSKQWFFL